MTYHTKIKYNIIICVVQFRCFVFVFPAQCKFFMYKLLIYFEGGVFLKLNASSDFSTSHLSKKLDEELIDYARDGNSKALDYLINKYRSFVRAKARTYFLIGAEREDIVQEGMIGLYKAIRDFRTGKLASFRAFAELCITRQIITAIKTATRQKHIPLNSYISLNKPIYDDECERTLMDIISEEGMSDPEEMMISREELMIIEERMGEVLSALELKVLSLYLQGSSYQDISVKLRRHLKSVDNALQRVKRKLEKHMEDQKLE